MQRKTCNLWIEKAEFRAIPTSGALTDEGEAIFDFKVAQETAGKFADLALDLGRCVASRGNHVHEIRSGITSFPVKQYEWSGLDLAIIQRSGRQLQALVGEAKTLLAEPEVGQGGVQLDAIVEALSFLPDNIILVKHV